MRFEQVATAFLTQYGAAYGIQSYPLPNDAAEVDKKYVALVVQKMRAHYHHKRKTYLQFARAAENLDPSGAGPSVQDRGPRSKRLAKRRYKGSDSEEEEEYREDEGEEECSEEEVEEECSKEEGNIVKGKSDMENARKRKEGNEQQAGQRRGYRHRRR